MALSAAQIDLRYLEVLSRHATAAEQATFVALSSFESTAQIDLDIATLPEATSFVDPLVRLYQGAFGRLPDTIDPNGNFDTGAQSGFWANTNALRSGISLQALANAFVVSAEFLTLYGSNAVTPALITAYYQHILGRDPASSEITAWQATGLNAAQILIGFTQSPEFIAKAQGSIDNFKVALAEGGHPTGPLLGPPAPAVTLVSDHDIGGVNEGSSVTFTLQSTTPADFGKTFNYNLTGSVSAADIVGGSLVGTVTLDATGKAFVTVTLVADAATEGAETLTLNVDGLSDTVTVNDTSKTPVVQNFTPVAGETLTGSAANDTFFGIVDRTFANDSGTFQNIVDKAVGGGGFDTLHLVVNTSNIDIVPGTTDVEQLLVTDLSGEDYNLANMANLQVIASDGSTGSMEFFNVQNIVDLSISNSDAGFGDIAVTVVDAAGTGDVDVNLNNAGDFDLDYFNTSGDSVVKNYAFHSQGDNHIDDLGGAEILETVTVDGSGTFHLDFQNGEDTRGVTSVDASTFDGDFLLHNLDGGASLTVLGAIGDNSIEIDEVDTNANVKVTTQDGDDFIDFDLDGNNGATITVVTGNGDDSVESLEGDNSDNTTFTITMGNGANDVDMDTGANSIVSITSGDGPTEIDLDAFNTPDAGPAGALTATIVVGNGANDIRVNSNANAGSDNGSNIKITAGNGGNIINTTSNNAAVVAILAGTGFDTVNATVNDGNSSVDVNVGSGGSSVSVTGGTGSVLKVTSTAGSDDITVDGLNAGAAASITVSSGADADSIHLAWLNASNPAVKVDAGTGNDRVELFQSTDVTANAVLDGGDGIDTLALTNNSVTTADINGQVKNFEALEVTTLLTNNINLLDFVNHGGSHMSHVILDEGANGSNTISGADTGLQLDILNDATPGGSNLTVVLNNSAVNTFDTLHLKLSDDIGGGDFGKLHVANLEFLTIESTTAGGGSAGITNEILIDQTPGNELNLKSLTILHSATGDSTITIDAEQIDTPLLEATGFTGGINADLGDNLPNQDITVRAPDAASSHIITFNGNDNITLGNGNNHVESLDGNDIIHVGSGSNLIEAGGGVDQVFFAAHAGQVDTIQFNNAGESSLSLPDVVTGFNQATDQINILFAANGGGNYDEVSSDAAVAATLLALNAASANGLVNVVLNITTGHVFMDVGSNGTLEATDMEINLVGVTHLTAGQFHT